MSQSDAVIQTIYRAIDAVNEDLPPADRIEKSPGAELFGGKGKLDSLALVTLIVSIEDAVARDLGRSITIASERAMSQKQSPFRTVQSLSEFVTGLLEDEARHD
jgi:acyl carrier protein